MTLTNEAEARDWFGTALGCSAATLGTLDDLVELLRAENANQNLVSAASLDHVWVRHLADSAQLLCVSRGTLCGPWLDLGSGAGFPGLIVALCRPDIEVILVESPTGSEAVRQRRYLDQANIEPLRSRLLDLLAWLVQQR